MKETLRTFYFIFAIIKLVEIYREKIMEGL